MEVSELQTGPGLIQPHLFGLSLQYMSLQYTWAAYSTPGFPTAHLVSYNRPAVPPTGASTVASHPWLVQGTAINCSALTTALAQNIWVYDAETVLWGGSQTLTEDHIICQHIKPASNSNMANKGSKKAQTWNKGILCIHHFGKFEKIQIFSN